MKKLIFHILSLYLMFSSIQWIILIIICIFLKIWINYRSKGKPIIFAMIKIQLFALVKSSSKKILLTKIPILSKWKIIFCSSYYVLLLLACIISAKIFWIPLFLDFFQVHNFCYRCGLSIDARQICKLLEEIKQKNKRSNWIEHNAYNF